MSTINGVSKLLNKRLEIVKNTEVFDTATDRSGLSSNVESFEYYVPLVDGASPGKILGKPLINLKPYQIVEVVDEIPLFRETNSNILQYEDGVFGEKILSEMKGNFQQIDVLMLVVKVIGQLPNTDPIGGTILGEGSYATIVYGLVGGQNEYGVRYVEYKGLLQAEQEELAASEEAAAAIPSNFVFVGDLQFDPAHSALKNTLLASYRSEKEDATTDVFHLPQNTKKSLADRGGYHSRFKTRVIDRIAGFRDPTDIVFVSFGSTDINQIYKSKNSYDTVIKRYKKILDDLSNFLFSAAASNSPLRNSKMIVIGVPPFVSVSPDDDSKPGSFHSDQSNVDKNPNKTIDNLNNTIKSHVANYANTKGLTSKYWFINPKDISESGWVNAFAHKSSDERMRYNGMSDDSAANFVARAQARGMFTTTPVKYEDTKPVDYLDWTQRCDAGNDVPYYVGLESFRDSTVDLVSETEKCTWYIPVRTLYNSTTDFRRFIPPVQAGVEPGSYVKVLDSNVNHTIEEKIEEYRQFAVRKLASHLVGGETNLDNLLQSEQSLLTMESLNSPNIFLSKPFKYTKRDEKDREVEVPASSAPEILSQATKKAQDVFVENRSGGRLWILYRVPEKIYNNTVVNLIEKNPDLKNINVLQSVKGVNYDFRIFLPVGSLVAAQDYGNRIEKVFYALYDLLRSDSCNYVVASDITPNAQFSYNKDGQELKKFFLALDNLLQENGFQSSRTGIVELGYKEVPGSSGTKNQLSYAYLHQGAEDGAPLEGLSGETIGSAGVFNIIFKKGNPDNEFTEAIKQSVNLLKRI